MRQRLHALLKYAPLAAFIVLTAAVAGFAASGALADNTDQTNTQARFAWGENIGWLKARPAAEAYGPGGSGVQVTDTDVLGYVWGENVGWVNLSCKNDASCGGASGSWGVKNDAAGHLSGYAWAENAGWINFSCATNATCGTVSYGVTIAMPGTFDYLKDWGHFSGQAWGENVGWINFGDAGLPPSVAIQTGWPSSSGDGYTDAQHIALGKAPFLYCKIMRADVNGNGKVTLADLILTAQQYNQLVPPAPARRDQNGDAKISLADLILQAQVYNQLVAACP